MKVVQTGRNLNIETEPSSVLVVFRCEKIGTEICEGVDRFCRDKFSEDRFRCATRSRRADALAGRRCGQASVVTEYLVQHLMLGVILVWSAVPCSAVHLNVGDFVALTSHESRKLNKRSTGLSEDLDEWIGGSVPIRDEAEVNLLIRDTERVSRNPKTASTQACLIHAI